MTNSLDCSSADVADPEFMTASQLKGLIVGLALDGYLSPDLAWFLVSYFRLVSA